MPILLQSLWSPWSLDTRNVNISNADPLHRVCLLSGPFLILNILVSQGLGQSLHPGPCLPSHFLPIFLPVSPNCFQDKSLHLSPIPHAWDPMCYCQHALVLRSAHLPGRHPSLTSGSPPCQPPVCLDVQLLPVAKSSRQQVLPSFWTSQLLGPSPKDYFFSRAGPLPLYLVPSYVPKSNWLSLWLPRHRFHSCDSLPSVIYGSN